MSINRNSNRLNRFAPLALLLLASVAILIVALVRIFGGGKEPVPGDSSANSSSGNTNTADSSSGPAASDAISSLSENTSVPDQTTDNTQTVPGQTADNSQIPDTDPVNIPTDSVTEDGADNNTMNNEDLSASFYISPISDEIFARIKGKSYPDGCTLSLDELRYLHVLHYDFDGNITEGEIIVNTSVAEDVLEIFRELFDIEYPIEKMVLIDAYDADDERSMEDNNTSAFNYRFIAESTTLSNHALGLAIDINPLYNPYVYTRKDGSFFLQPYNAGDYVDREKDNPYYIRRNDACYNLFIEHGFTWGGDWNTKKDYQHFEKTK